MTPLGVPTKDWLASTCKADRTRRAKAARSRARHAAKTAITEQTHTESTP